jgi:hypothetical protein
MPFRQKDEQIAKEYPTIENTPEMVGLRCQFLAYSLFFGLVILPLLISLYIWFEYDWLLAIGGGLFLYLVSAIVGSKLRLESLPIDQRERNFSSLEIAKWYVSKHFCY